MEPRQRIVSEILQERMNQSEKYSNTHDDNNSRYDRWKVLIGAYLRDVKGYANRITRHRLIQIAAMCICAIESIDRITGARHDRNNS